VVPTDCILTYAQIVSLIMCRWDGRTVTAGIKKRNIWFVSTLDVQIVAQTPSFHNMRHLRERRRVGNNICSEVFTLTDGTAAKGLQGIDNEYSLRRRLLRIMNDKITWRILKVASRHEGVDFCRFGQRTRRPDATRCNQATDFLSWMGAPGTGDGQHW